MSWIIVFTSSMVSVALRLRMIVLPVSVFTRTCMLSRGRSVKHSTKQRNNVLMGMKSVLIVAPRVLSVGIL